MAKVAAAAVARLLVVAVLTPAVGQLPRQGLRVAGHARPNGAVDWAAASRSASRPGYGLVADILTLAYLWLPYMILPIYAGLERLPDSLLEASGDLGAPAGRTFRSVVLPLLFPSIVAGSIFTFSLSPRRLHHASRSSAARHSCSATSSTPTSARPTTCRSPPRRHLPGGRSMVDLPRRGAPHRRAGQPVSSDVVILQSPRADPVRLAMAVGLRLHLRAAARGPGQLVQRRPDFGWPPTGFTLEWWSRLASPGRAGRAVDRSRPGSGRPHRAGARHDGGLRRAALPLLRPGDRLASWWSCRSRCRASSPASR